MGIIQFMKAKAFWDVLFEVTILLLAVALALGGKTTEMLLAFILFYVCRISSDVRDSRRAKHDN